MSPGRAGGRIEEEMEHHVEELARQLEAAGLTPERARAEALRRFGDRARIARATRAAGARPLERLTAGLRGECVQVLRGLRRTPAFTTSVLLTLGLALGAALAVSAVIWDVILRPLDLRDADRLVALVERMPETGVEGSPVSQGTYHDWRHELGSASSVVAYQYFSSTLEDPERPVHLATVEVSGDFFQVLGVRPLLGRVFTPADEAFGGPPTVVLLSHDLWLARFGGDPGVVGRTLPIDGTSMEVVGVLPPRLDLQPARWAEVWLPNPHTPVDPTNRGSRTLHVIARLQPGAALADVQGEVAALAERIARDHPTSARGWSADARPLRAHVLGDAERPLAAATAGVALLLLIAAVNVTNLLQVRAADRGREMAVRAAVGAGRLSLVRLGLVEALVLGAGGGAGGLLVAWGLRGWLLQADPGVLPRTLGAGLPLAVGVFGVLLAGAVALVVGAAAAWGGTGQGLTALGRSAGVGVAGGRARPALVVAQLALTAVLLVGAGLLVRTVSALGSVDIGYEPRSVVAARFSLDGRRYPGREEQRLYFDALLERVRAIPGVSAAGLTSSLPMDPVAASFDLPTLSDAMAGLDWAQAPQVDLRIVSPGLVEALGLRLVRGRTLELSDDAGAPLVALVNRSLAELFWPGEDPLGRRVQSIWRRSQWIEVVGVVEDTRFYGPRRSSHPELLVPLGQITWTYMTVVARMEGDLTAAGTALERAMLETDPLLPPHEVFPVASLVDATRASEGFYALLLSGFAVLALALAAAGVYGTFAYTVRLRTKEMGVRLALGARRSGVVGTILGRGVALAGLGVAAGVLVSIPATSALEGMLFGVKPLDPTTLAGVAAVLLSVAAGACLHPAIRAARLDPAKVLRQD